MRVEFESADSEADIYNLGSRKWHGRCLYKVVQDVTILDCMKSETGCSESVG